MGEESTPPGGLLETLRRLIGTCAAIVQNRTDLLAVELQEEKWHFLQVFVWALVAVFLGAMAMALVTCTVIYLFWERSPVAVLLVLAGLYGGGCVWCIARLKRRLKAHSSFAGTLNELKKDRAWLETKN